jgi:hypothetical protein
MNHLLFGVSIFVALVGAVYIGGRWILGPIDRAASQRRAPLRFSIGDFLCLFLVVQLPLTLVSRLRSDDTEAAFWICSILAWVVAPIIWISCAASLSRAGIRNGKHRLLFMGLILPIVYYGLTPFVIMAAIGIVMLLRGEIEELFRPWWLVPLWAFMGASLCGCGWYTNWLVKRMENCKTPDAC